MLRETFATVAPLTSVIMCTSDAAHTTVSAVYTQQLDVADIVLGLKELTPQVELEGPSKFAFEPVFNLKLFDLSVERIPYGSEHAAGRVVCTHDCTMSTSVTRQTIRWVFQDQPIKIEPEAASTRVFAVTRMLLDKCDALTKDVAVKTEISTVFVFCTPTGTYRMLQSNVSATVEEAQVTSRPYAWKWRSSLLEIYLTFRHPSVDVPCETRLEEDAISELHSLVSAQFSCAPLNYECQPLIGE